MLGKKPVTSNTMPQHQFLHMRSRLLHTGKTTLLSIMGGRAQRSLRHNGTALFNGVPLTKERKRRIGYVMQDDLLYE